MKSGRRYWDDRSPIARRASWPAWKSAKDPAGNACDVVIVGGGLTGAACAYAFAAAGHDVVLLEGDRVAGGGTAASAGVLLPALDESFASLDAAHGRRASRGMWQQARRGVLEFAAVLRKLGIRCDLESTTLITVSRDVKSLAKEYAARRDAGLGVTKIPAPALARETALEGSAIRTPGTLVFDPVRAALGLASHAAKKGARIHERSLVTRIRHLPRGGGVEVKTAAGVIAARAVIVATGAPGAIVPQLRRHFVTRDTYLVVTEAMPAAMRKAVGSRASVVMDAAAPPHSLRWLKEDRVLIAGADQAPAAPRLAGRTLVQRTGQLLYELSLMYPDVSGIQPAYAWSAPLVTTSDGAPYIGPHRNLPAHLFALGLGRHGDGLSWLAARSLLRYYEAAPLKEDAVFGFTRHE
ncbi:MAG: FAD-binding oxidoreductase [Acidobacteriota bacterium]|nr:FAD-binding oxidoreductase [Acidobacteriota bacterium]